MNIRTLVASVGLALATLTTVGAQAQDAAAVPLTLTPVGDALAATFTRSVSGVFVDTFSFVPTSVSGLVSVTLTPVGGSVDFFAALLNDQGFGFFPELGQTSFSFQSTLDTLAPLTLTVFGFAGNSAELLEAAGSYSGSVRVESVSVIPEPHAYALMLMGLGVVGYAVHRRRSRRAM